MRSLLLLLVALTACVDAPGPSFEGSLSGTITGSTVGPLVGVTLTITPTGSTTSITAVTRSGGVYSADVVDGPGQIALSTLPPNCQAPQPASYAVSMNTTSVVNIQVACASGSSTGTVTGTVTSSLGGGIANAQVTLTPSVGSALPAVTTDMNGNYSVTMVPPGSGSIAISNLPTNCTAPAPQPYSGLVAGQTVTASVTVSCNAAEGYLVYNGTTSYAEIPSAPQLSVGANGLTIAVWMRPDVLTFQKTQGSLANEQYVHWLGKGEGSGATGDEEWTFRMYSQVPGDDRGNRISFYVFNPDGHYGCGSYFQDSITPGQWIHVVGVVNTDSQTTEIYKNGVFRHSDSYAALITPNGGTAPMRIGSKDFNSFFQGAIGPVRVWNRALASSEIAALYASSTVPQSGLVAEYPTNEGQGTTLTDDIVGNNGMVFNTAWGSGPRTPMATSAATQSGGGC